MGFAVGRGYGELPIQRTAWAGRGVLVPTPRVTAIKLGYVTISYGSLKRRGLSENHKPH